MIAVTGYFNGRPFEIEEGRTGTIKCAGQIMAGDFSIEFVTAGSFTCGGITTSGRNGKKSGIKCKGMRMTSDIVIMAGEPEEKRSPFPIEIADEDELYNILANATTDSVGAVYKYTGAQSYLFENGRLYMICEES